LLRVRGALGLAGILLAGLGLGAAAGVYADQAYPEQLPLIANRAPAQNLDQATFNRALRVIKNNYYNPRPNYADLSHGTVRGLVGGLDDRFSYYLDPASVPAPAEQLLRPVRRHRRGGELERRLPGDRYRLP